MTRVAYSEDLYFLLLKVTRAVVLFHDSCEAHIPGFSWVGSDMTEWAQESLKDFRHAGLIEVGRHEPWGSAVSLSDAGVVRLAEWRERRLTLMRGAA
jgi:hypothetical protein